MSFDLVVQQALNGISFGALLFILAAGLSLIFGMMDVVNLAHGAFYMLGAYVALQVVQLTRRPAPGRCRTARAARSSWPSRSRTRSPSCTSVALAGATDVGSRYLGV